MTTLEVCSAYDEKLIAEVPLSDRKALNAAIKRLNASYLDRDNWLKPYERAQILEKAALMKQHEKRPI